MRRALAKSLGAVEERFIMQVQTDNAGSSANNEFTIPWIGTYDVDWGDGNTDTGVVDTQTHTYASAGTYDVAVTATTGRIVFNNGGDKLKLLDIKNWGSCQWTSMENAFVGCASLTNLSAFDIPDFSLMTSMSSMFRLCVNLTANDSINTWDVSGITNMLSTFWQCYSFNQNIGSWDVSNVTVFCDNFNGMFKDASSFNNGGSDSIRNWDISSATALGGTFSKSGMFKGAASFNQPVNDWDTSNITITRNTFRNASTFNQPLDNWDTSNITDMQNMFANASVFNQSLAAWNIDQVADFNNFMTQVTLSTANYDATLISWAAQTPQQNINITFGNSQYTLGGAAETARNTLINTYGWTITDGGGI